MAEIRYTSPQETADVTEEILSVARGIVDGWYDEGRIDWEDVWDRMERTELNDGTRLDMGEDLNSPALRKIRAVIRKERS